ncbi:glucose dehydrogenase [FAD, quinone]-like isoform X2 [Bombyx mandarina]|uniref:Glucose-methanol-choline oxidoreductase N-terminal domain-containing protein n=2 Tax=Bombyx TaxID=7090 RepID=A0A8R2DLG3_BOMMO|nr:glucose dehydrogenase [FAD, quinone] [Bombyx mori]XP_028043356.1 glucose dehydrogenase [FAD, quinone]-like isoform X1 [Bombyx mandarina]XP_028043357.1 glucose dehydrogenase [FAD, quinone]-like isoform X2 [Bombyx mandarina]
MLQILTTFLMFLIMIGIRAFEEDYDIEYYDDLPENHYHKEGRSFSYPQSPIIDLIMKTAAPNYVPKNSGDIFDFLRDSYPLPGGLHSPYHEYDFVIIGAGSAGSVLASRLTEDKNTTVLLIEAGKPEMILTDIPIMAPYFQSTEYAWQYYMEPQPGVCKGMINGRCFWPRGKAVGGSSVINYMIYTRGRPQDWDRIAAAGNYGWSYREVLEYYKKSENARLNGYEKDPTRNRNGENPVEFVPIRTKLIKAFLEAGRIFGHPTIDYNSPHQLGFGYVQAITTKGHRQSAAKVFLHRQKKRQNLHILPDTYVTKILIDARTKTAYGVEYVRNRLKHTVLARKEVILSAGPIASPQLLMLSGVGPKKHLNSMGIPVLKDLPVGKMLYDHICFPGLIFELNTTDVSLHESKMLRVRPILQWLKNGDSTLSSPGGVEGIGYIKTPISNDPDPIPDIELISIGGSILSDGGPGGSRAIRRGMRIRDAVIDEAFGSIDRVARDTWSAFILLLHPVSFGGIELKNKNPFSHPRMYGNYLTHSKDVVTIIAGIRYVQAMAATFPFQKFGAKVHKASYPTCRHIPFDSDEYWECAIRTLTATLHHQIATCRMGPNNDPLAVVDPELRVYGIEKLRVVDSGVIPRTISAHTHAPTMMIAEKAADMIKATWASMLPNYISYS